VAAPMALAADYLAREAWGNACSCEETTAVALYTRLPIASKKGGGRKGDPTVASSRNAGRRAARAGGRGSAVDTRLGVSFKAARAACCLGARSGKERAYGARTLGLGRPVTRTDARMASRCRAREGATISVNAHLTSTISKIFDLGENFSE
jgi:hypothetical protein